MNIDHAKLESLAREICDSRNGAGHYDAKGTKRAVWRRQAAELIGNAGSLWGLVALVLRIGRPV